MKIQSLFLIAMLFICVISKAQVKLSTSDIQIPDAPGFSLDDAAPSIVEKPVNPRALGISLYSLLQGGAIQATPFWLVQQKLYDHKKFLNNKFPLVETFNFSISTSKKEDQSKIAAGIRAHLIRIYSKSKKDSVLALVDSAAVKIADSMLPEDEIRIKAEMEKYAKKIAQELSKASFRLELAAAYLGTSNNSSFKSLHGTKSGVWLSSVWSPLKSDNMLIAGNVRYIIDGSNQNNMRDSACIDYGLSLSYRRPNADASIEYVKRNPINGKNKYDRVAFVINYQIIDEITIVASLGKNFTDVNNIFTAFGIKFGLRKKQ